MKEGEDKEFANTRNPFGTTMVVTRIIIGVGGEAEILEEDCLHEDWTKRVIPPKKGFPLWTINYLEDNWVEDKRGKDSPRFG